MTVHFHVLRRILGESAYIFYLEFRREDCEKLVRKAEFSMSSLRLLCALKSFTQPAKMQLDDHDLPVRANRYLTRLERQQVAAQLWEEKNMATGEPVLAFGAVGRCAKKFGVKAPAISKIWKHMKENFAKGIPTTSPEPQRRQNILPQDSSLPSKVPASEDGYPEMKWTKDREMVAV